MGFYEPSTTCQVPELSELYEAAFGQRRDGTFVEVGAFDGDTYSNTSCLADLGWRGLYIEPVPKFAQVCRWRHFGNQNVTVEECAVGATPGRLPIHIAKAFSSFHPAVIEDAKAAYDRLSPEERLMPFEAVFGGEVVPVDVVRLEMLLAKHRIKPGFDLLVVDVEGHETEVFDSFDLAGWQPTMVIAELVDRALRPTAAPGEPASDVEALRARILSCGYRSLYVDAANTVFVRAS
jgi:FkbM family methyltransferase